MLPSQNREGRDRRYMYHRGRPSRLIVLAVGATLLVAGGSWWFSRDKADEADPGDPPVVVSDDSEGVGQSPLGTPEASLDRSDSVLTELPTPAEARAEPPAAAPKPREITMGRPADLGAAEEPAVETDASTRDAARVMHRPPRPAGNGRAVLSDRVPADVRRVADTALALVDTDPVLARTMLTQVLLDPAIGRRDAATLRETLTMLSDRLVFSAECMPGDPFSIECSVRSGDSLSRIKSRYGLQIEWSLLKRVNGIQDERRLQVGQRLKLVTGPFHAVIDKSDYRMDIYLGPSDDLVYVRSFDVGLGEGDSTPVGLFHVKPQSKLVNPQWVNPRTREPFAADDPANPIGERWIGLEGVSASIRGLTGYGIHGTIDPASIGDQRSMGCIRMSHDDVCFVYELLVEGASQVRIWQAGIDG